MKPYADTAGEWSVPARTADKGYPFLFVYGTLLSGLREDWRKKVRAELVGEGTIKGRLYDLGDYPGVRLAGGRSAKFVRGELYRLGDPERATRILDQYEHYFPVAPEKSLFIRELVMVTLLGRPSEPRALASVPGGTLADGNKRRAWTYLYNRPVDHARLIPSGSYRDLLCACPRS